MKNNNSNVVAVVGDFLYLYRYFKNFYKDLRTIGNYEGYVLVVTSFYTPTFLIKELFLNRNIKIKRFKKIKFNKTIRKRYLSLDTNQQPNRFRYKNFQWFKLNLFNTEIKNEWSKVLYLDINFKIHYDINNIFNINISNKFLAKADGYPEYKMTLKSQFDSTQKEISELENNFNLDDKHYFQTGLMLFDTAIIQKDTLQKIINLAISYPISITNEQGILNLFFQKYSDYKYEELPENLGEFIIYYYWQIPGKKILITKQLDKQYK